MVCLLPMGMLAMQSLVESKKPSVAPESLSVAQVSGAPVICCAIYGVIAKVELGPVFSLFGDPEKVQPELFARLDEEARGADGFTNALAEAQPGKSWPTAVKAWLIEVIDGNETSRRARKKISRLNLKLYLAAGSAFEPDAQKYMVPIAENVAALEACQKAGCTLVLVSNWRRDCLKPLVEQKATKDVLALFDEDKRFISGDLKMLTSNVAFFNRVKKSVNANNDAASQFFYLDIPLGQESLDAAQKAGMTPITVSPKTSLAAQLAAQGVPMATESSKLGK